MTLLTTLELEVAVAALPYMTQSMHTLDECKVCDSVATLEAEWAAWLAKTYAPNFTQDFHARLYARVWADKYDYGYAGVEYKYRELAEFAVEAANNFRKNEKR